MHFEGECATWPSSKSTCAGGDGKWAILNRTTTTPNECEKLCIDRKWNWTAMPVHNGLKNGNGCCFVGKRYGCWWKDGAIQANEEGGNSNIGDYKAVTCTSTLMRFYQFHEKCSFNFLSLYL